MNKCTDCKEYNQEKHYCPKFCDVIRDTTKEMQEFYKGEHEKLEKIEQLVNSDDLTSECYGCSLSTYIREIIDKGESHYKNVEHEKLEKIEQIVKDHDNDRMPEDFWYIDKIREVLENE